MRSLWGGLLAAALVCACDPVESKSDDQSDGDIDGGDGDIDGGNGPVDADTRPDAQMCSDDVDCPSGHCLDSVCVECETTADCRDGQVCDAEDHVCRGCEGPLDCESQVCDPVERTCVSSDLVVYVSSSGTFNNCGTMAAPCSQLNDGIALLTPQRYYLSVFGTHQYQKHVLAGKVVVVGNKQGIIDLTSSGGLAGPILDIKPGSDVVIDGLSVQDNSEGNGINCQQSLLRVSNSKVTNNDGTGISGDCALTVINSEISYNNYGVQGGRLTLHGNTIVHNSSTGVSGQSDDVDIRNNLIAYNSYQFGYSGAIELYSSGSAGAGAGIIAFNTIVANQTNGYERGNVACGYQRDGTPPLLDSNILWDHRVTSENVDPVRARVTDCAIGRNVTDVALNLTSISGDPRFLNAGAEDYHITAGSSAIGEGNPAHALPVDHDGKPRPAAPAMGAYEPTADP